MKSRWRFVMQGEVVWYDDEAYLGHFWVSVTKDEIEAGCRVSNNAVVRRWLINEWNYEI